MGKWKVGVISASDSIARGDRADDRIPIIRNLTRDWLDVDVAVYRAVTDDMEDLQEHMIELVDREKCDLLIVTGGTGLSPRDVTPEVTEWVIDRTCTGAGGRNAPCRLAAIPPCDADARCCGYARQLAHH